MAQTSQETAKSKNETETETVHHMSDAELKAAQDAGRTALENIDDQEIDDVLADIDDVLEENAQEVVGNFIQRGGQ